MGKLTIFLGGDIVPTRNNEHLFINGDGRRLLGDELLKELTDSDANIFNLETPLCDELTPIAKCGPNLHALSACVNGLRAMNITALGCANNHILDHGYDAMFLTKSICNEYGMDVFGIGKNLQEAAKPYVVKKNGKKVGIYACAEHEFTIATRKKAGANPYDPLYSFDHVEELKKACDYIIVMFHGGKEYFRYPSPEIQRICRRFIEKGADLVVTQHSHCIGCREDYLDGSIIYGQGNFLFDQNNKKNRSYYASGLLLKIEIFEKKIVKELPVVLDGFGCISLAGGEERNIILSNYEKRSREIQKEGFIENAYAEFALRKIENYLRIPLGRINDNYLYRLINVALGHNLHNIIFGRKHLLEILNMIECEAHRELWISGIKKKYQS